VNGTRVADVSSNLLFKATTIEVADANGTPAEVAIRPEDDCFGFATAPT
jgi:hypothetical protein